MLDVLGSKNENIFYACLADGINFPYWTIAQYNNSQRRFSTSHQIIQMLIKKNAQEHLSVLFRNKYYGLTVALNIKSITLNEIALANNALLV